MVKQISLAVPKRHKTKAQKTKRPMYLPHIVRVLARCMDQSVEDVTQHSFQNACSFLECRLIAGINGHRHLCYLQWKWLPLYDSLLAYWADVMMNGLFLMTTHQNLSLRLFCLLAAFFVQCWYRLLCIGRNP